SIRLFYIFSPEKLAEGMADLLRCEDLKMSYQPIDLVILARKIEALQAAMSLTLASLSTVSPVIKNDVVENLENFSSNHQDPTVKQAYSELANRIKNLDVTIR
uniref:hypothetical protein n=2 Tax=Proteus mirabilis TaxID=584 RepID=UPI00202438D2